MKAKEIIDKQDVRYSSKQAYFDDFNKFIMDKGMLDYKDDGSILYVQEGGDIEE